jgi:tRNA pseudouridine synthase 10
MKVLDVAISLLERYPLCDHCLGRQFALLGHGLTNRDRGHTIKLSLTIDAHRSLLEKREDGARVLQTLATNGMLPLAGQILEEHGLSLKKPESKCYICENAFQRLDGLSRQALEKLSAYEFSSFLVGSELPAEIENREDEVKALFGLRWGEDIRNEVSREIGKRVAESTGKRVEYKRPDIVVLVNPFSDSVNLKVSSVFIAGRYKKLVRGIPQAAWICRACRGKGCPRCHGTGRMYQESVEGYIATPILEAVGGSDEKIHAAGREDIDARALGTGRPFIMEVRDPKRRNIDLQKLQTIVNKYARGKVRVTGLRTSSKEEVVRLKSVGQTEKTYQATIEFQREISDNDLRRLENSLTGLVVKQLTPKRVSHRRSNRVRERQIYEAKAKRLGPRRAELLLKCQGGLYVKELVSGDDGRTKLSVAEILNNPAKCTKLDVLAVVMEGF